MNKKGSVLYVAILFIIVIVIFGVVNLLSYQAFTFIDDDILQDLTLNESKTVITDVRDTMPSIFDTVILIVFAGLWTMGIISGIMKDEHPALFGFMMLAIVAVIIAGAFMANSFEEFFQDEEISSMIVFFPKTFWIITHLFEVSILMAVSTLLAVMAKNRL